MSVRPLEDLTVVDCSEGVAGAYAGRLLADLGATVLKVEPPGGDRVRSIGPFRDDRPTLEGGGLHLALNAGKRSLLLDLATPVGREHLASLLNGAEILLESKGPGGMSALGFGYDDVADSHPGFVYVSHSPFGNDGPYAGRVTSEIVDYAMGGFMYFSGDPARHPLLLPGHQAELHAGMHLAAGALLALWHARATGQGQHVEVSTMEAMLNDHSWLTTMWTHLGQVQGREPSAMIPCLDGYIFWMPVANPQLWVLIERPDLIDDPRWTAIDTWRAALPEVRGLVAEWAAGRTKAEIYHTAQAMRIAITPVNSMADIAASPQLAARGWWRTLTGTAIGDVEVPGPPWNFSASESGPAAPAPLLNEAAGLTIPARSQRQATRQDRTLPLEGIRVLEVTANWAGPLAGRHLGDLGADVIKIETARRPATRALHQSGGQMWTRPYNRAGYFNLLNRNKRDLVADLASPEGRDIFLRLVDTADVVLENNSARVFQSFGLPYPVLSARNPRIIMCSISGMGATGPERDYVAYGSNIEASTGLVSQLGYGDGPPFGTGSYYADPIAGTHATIGIMAALLQRETTGTGQFIDMALQESGMSFNVEALMDFQLNGRVAGQSNNRSRRVAPQAVYPSAGIDCWLAIGIESDGQWRSLCTAIGTPGLADRFPSLESRVAGSAEIDATVAAWSRSIDHQEATVILQRAGVPAGPVLANWEIVSDPHLFHRGYFVDVVHPEVGHHRWDGYPWRLSATPGRIRRAAPLFGEHNDEVLDGDIGLPAGEVASLRARGIVADRPLL